jgi:hypothetical protein
MENAGGALGEEQAGEHAHGRQDAESGNDKGTDVKEDWMHLSGA